jgi:hypothetical protein
MVNLMSWKACITAFGKLQKKPLEHNLHERQSSTSAIPYGEFIASSLSRDPIATESLAMDGGKEVKKSKR